MTLFDEDVAVVPAPRPPVSRRTRIGLWSLTIALVSLLVMSFLPTAYVIEQPGPVYDTLGTVTNNAGDQVPLIEVNGAPTYPTTGSLDLLTVQVVGNRERTPSWFELAGAWLDPSRAIVPIDAIFPAGQSSEQRQQESTAMMVDSQEEAKAAALSQLGYQIPQSLAVQSVSSTGAAAGILQAGDDILAANGTPVSTADQLRAAIAAGQGAPLDLTITRGGQTQHVTITPTAATQPDGTTTWLVGITLGIDYKFPIDVTIQLDNVGGPSAGMMFALGIIDTLTPGELTGGHRIAGTGTITADGTVGPIGGIRQKLYGAKGAGAEYFLAPASNCNEVTGHVPSGLRVFSVSTLADSLTALDAIRTGGNLDALPTC
ncbi:S16 family serine protease [Microbacterium sp. X-17]|uniref:YlbL family protein n=1 Tax=Microbacterium sp. X-17 TaxID=3144404 RepID=UPI0031F4A610